MPGEPLALLVTLLRPSELACLFAVHVVKSTLPAGSKQIDDPEVLEDNLQTVFGLCHRVVCLRSIGVTQAQTTV